MNWTKLNKDAAHQRASNDARVRAIHDKMRSHPSRQGMQLRDVLSRIPCQRMTFDVEKWDGEIRAHRWYSAEVVVKGKAFLIDVFAPRHGGGTPNEEKARRKQKIEYCERNNIPYLPLHNPQAQEMELRIRDFIRRELKGG